MTLQGQDDKSNAPTQYTKQSQRGLLKKGGRRPPFPYDPARPRGQKQGPAQYIKQYTKQSQRGLSKKGGQRRRFYGFVSALHGNPGRGVWALTPAAPSVFFVYKVTLFLLGDARANFMTLIFFIRVAQKSWPSDLRSCPPPNCAQRIFCTHKIASWAPLGRFLVSIWGPLGDPVGPF